MHESVAVAAGPSTTLIFVVVPAGCVPVGVDGECTSIGTLIATIAALSLHAASVALEA